MADKKVYPIPIDEDIVDKNGLNQDSVKFAKYYYLNNKEIKRIRSKYAFIWKHSVNNSINEDSMRLWVMMSKNSLLVEIFRIYKRKPMSWNDFFQLIMFCCLSPMASFFTFVLHLIPEYNNKIDMDIIRKFFSFVGKGSEVDGMKDLFHRYDINRDGSISFNQFLSLLSHRYNSCKSFYTFKIKMLGYFFTDEKYKIILNRRRNIKHIKDYKFNNHDKLISQPCLTSLQQFFNGESHPDRFDYDCEIEEISYSFLTNVIINKYHSVCKTKKSGNLHHLDMFKENEITYEIDKYYIEYNRMISNIVKIKMPSQYKQYTSTSVLSLDLSTNGGGNTNRTSSSILRCSTYSTSNRTSTNTISVTPITVGKFKNIRKSINKEDFDLSK